MLNFKNKKVLLAAIAVSCGLLAGCADNTTILPHGNNRYTVVALSHSEGDATKSAMKKATDICAQTGKSVNVVEHRSVYQGLDKKDKALAGFAGDVLDVVSRDGFGSSHSETTDDDYKVTLEFVCQ
jgi:hypothetical protein